MALTDEDKKRLSKQDQDRILTATAKWEAANAAGDEAGKKAAADEAKKIREQAGYYTDSYGRYQGNLQQGQNKSNGQITSTSEQEAMDRAFNEGFYGTDIPAYEMLNPFSINQAPSRTEKQKNTSPRDPFLEGLWGEDAPTQQDAYYSGVGNINQQSSEIDPDFEKAFLEGFMGEDYVKELQANTKNTAQTKQEKYSSAANNKNNYAGSDIGKKTVRAEGLHYLPNGGTDSYGRKLPAGSYIRVVNGKEYIVLPGDPRIKERIEAEYQKQKNTQPQADAAPIQSDTVQKTETQVASQQVPSPEAETEEDFWENVFEQPQEEEEYIELPNNIFGEDEIDTSDYDSFVDYIEENGLYYDFYAGSNEQGEKVRFAELYDRETGERLATLQEGKDFFYAKDGVFFTKDFTYHSRGRKILEMRAGIHVGDDARDLFEGLGYEISLSGNTIYITDEAGKTLSFDRGKEFSATKNGIFIAPGALNSKTIQDLIKNSPKSRIKEQILDVAERITKNAADVSQDEFDVLSQYISLFENDTEAQAALEIIFDDEEKAEKLEGELSELDVLADPKTKEDEATAAEMVFATVLQLTLGYTHKTGNKVFDNTLKMVSFAMLFSPLGFTQTIIKKAIGNVAIKGLLKLAGHLLTNKNILTKAESGIMNFIKGSQFIDKIASSYNSADALIYGISQLTGNNDLPQGIKDLLKRIYDNINQDN